MSSKQSATWYQRTAIWLGIGINPASITLGGSLAAVLPWGPLLIAFVVGSAILIGLCIAQGIASRRRQAPLAKRAADTFGGSVGAPLLNIMIAIGMVGWGGFYNGVAGANVTALLAGFGYVGPDWIGPLILILLVLGATLLGITRWNALLWVTTGAAMALAIFGLFAVQGDASGAVIADAFAMRDLFWATGTVTGYAILFALRCADFSWDLKADGDVIKSAAFLLGTLLVAMTIGAVLYRITGDWNLAAILAEARFALLGQIFLIVAVMSPTLSSLHSGRLALESITRLPQQVSLLLMCALIFALGVTRFDLQLIPFLDMIGALLPPSLVVMLLLPWFTRGREINPRIRWVAFAVWMVAALVALLLKLNGQVLHMFAGAAVSFVGIWLGLAILDRVPEPAG